MLVTMRMGGRSTKGWRSNLILNREIVRGNQSKSKSKSGPGSNAMGLGHEKLDV